MEDERGFGERVQCCLEKMFSQLKCLLTAKLCEEFQVLAGHLDLYGKELFCYRRKKEQKKRFCFWQPAIRGYDCILPGNHIILNRRNTLLACIYNCCARKWLGGLIIFAVLAAD